MRQIEILLIEDNPDDVELTRIALRKSKLMVHLSVVMDGVDAMKFLRKEGSHASSPTPDVILLDLNLPKLDGREVLMALKEDDGLKHIPVIVLTTSESASDIAESYKHHANAYITKPMDFQQFKDIVMAIEDFWFTIVRLPEAK